MKNFSKILLASLLTISLASCGQKENNNSTSNSSNTSSSISSSTSSSSTSSSSISSSTSSSTSSSIIEVEKPDTSKVFDLLDEDINFNKLGDYKALECKYGDEVVSNVTFTIADENIADIVNGVVIAKNYGETTITATYVIGDVTKTDTCTVKFNKPVIDTTKEFNLVQDEIKFTKLGEYVKLVSKYGDDIVTDVNYSINETVCCTLDGDLLVLNAGISAAKPVTVTATYKIGDVTKTDTCNVVTDIKYTAAFTKFTDTKNNPIIPEVDEKGNRIITMHVGDKIKLYSEITNLPIANTNALDSEIYTYSKNVKINRGNAKNGVICEALTETNNPATVTCGSGTSFYFPGYKDLNGELHYYNMNCKTENIKIIVIA